MRIIAILLITILIPACSSREYVPYSHLKVRTFNLNVIALQAPVSVRLRSDSTRREVEHFSILADSAQWIAKATNEPVVIPLENLQHFTVRDRRKGLGDGLWIGGVVGLLAGTVVHLSDPTATTPPVIALTTVTGSYFGMLIGGIIGADVHYFLGASQDR